MKTLYFSETSPADAAGDAILLPRSSYLGCEVINESSIDMHFKKIDGTHDVTEIRLTGNTGEVLNLIRGVHAAMASHSNDNVIDIVERANRNPIGGILTATNRLIVTVSIP